MLASVEHGLERRLEVAAGGGITKFPRCQQARGRTSHIAIYANNDGFVYSGCLLPVCLPVWSKAVCSPLRGQLACLSPLLEWCSREQGGIKSEALNIHRP